MERQPAPSGGIFDKQEQPKDNIVLTKERPSEPQKDEANSRKEDFQDPFSMQAAQNREMESKGKRSLEDTLTSGEAAAQATAEAINNQGSGSSVDLDKEDEFSEQDLKLAEQMIFNGHAEFDVSMPSIPNIKMTICSTSAEEIGMIDEIAFDMVKDAKELKDGNVDMPQNRINSMRNALFIALSYKGKNQQELMKDQRAHLNTLKKAIQKVSDLYSTGQVEDADNLKKSVKQALIARATVVNRMPTPLIDFLSNTKYEFDDKISRIMNSKGILPKS